MRSGTCPHCSQKDWSCPYPQCSMSSNRHWNVMRHLERTHDRVGMPLNQNDFTSMYKESPSRERSLSPTAVASSVAAASLSSAHKQEKNNDLLDHVLPALRKVAEFKNLLSELSPSSQGIPISASSYGFTHAACNRPSNAFRNPAYSQAFGFNDDEFEIVGYRGYTCRSCLTNHPLAIYTRKRPELGQQQQQQQLQIIPTEHQCDSQRLISCSSSPTETKNKIIADLHYRLPESITNAVNGWTKNRSCLLSFEIPYNIQKGCSIDLFPKHENHWSTRAIKKRQTAFNNAEELKDFICSANNTTFGIFNVHLQSQQKDSKSTYFLFVSPINTKAP
jgi:hypothetical protein